MDPPRAVNGVRLTLPAQWTVESVDLLRFGTEPVPVEVRRTSATAVAVRAERPIRGPHELVLRVRLPEATGRRTWTVRPGLTEESAEARAAPRRQTVAIEAPQSPDATNRALSLEEASGPVQLRPDALSFLGRSASFTLAFWMRTTGLDEVVLSTWSGDEDVAYPAEVVVDRSGRLRFYSGRPGAHQALWTHAPVADGQWHHVAVVYDAADTRLRLMLDGRPTDSLHNYRSPRSSGPLPVALGGRPGGGERAGASAGRPFSGHLDEVRITEGARVPVAPEQVRATPASDEPGVRLSFEDEARSSGLDAAGARWPEGARRVPSTLSLRSPLRNLRAHSDASSVTLRWAAPPSDHSTFVVERSTDRRAFEPVARVQPEDARQAFARDEVEYEYTDSSVPERIVFYRIRQDGADRTSRTTATIKVGVGANTPDTTAASLLKNFPNPFRERTTIAYEVHEPTPLALSVWTVTGTRVRTIVDRRHSPGYYEAPFEATSLPSGAYFVQMKTPRGTQSTRMVVLK